MKVYYTETQADYESLMVALEAQGCRWISGVPPTAKEWWHGKEPFIKVENRVLTWESSDCGEQYHVPIIKYKRRTNMKIYRTETQEDYKALMAELEAQGCKWLSGIKPTDKEKHATGALIKVDNNTLSWVGLDYGKEYHVPVIQYKKENTMKIYYTETQEDYYDLMAKLEAEGCEWASTDSPTQLDIWKFYRTPMGVIQAGNRIRHGELEYYKTTYPTTPIIKHKAKAEDKMRFTKDNVYKIFSQFRKDNNYSLNQLQHDILQLDATSEKVVVPKLVADAFDHTMRQAHEVAEAKDIPHILTSAFTTFGGPDTFLTWVRNNPEKYVMAIMFGYVVEKQKLYHVVTKEGHILLYRRHGGRIEPTKKTLLLDSNGNADRGTYQLTEEEIKHYDKRFWAFAIPVKDIVK